MKEPREGDVYGLLAEFSTGEELMSAARRIRSDGYKEVEAYTPFAVEGLDDLVKMPCRYWLRWIVFAGGIMGGMTGFGLQYYAAAVSYPLNIGGRPPDSWPAFIPITFELTVLGAAICGVVGLLWLGGLPLLYHPVFSAASFRRATSDRFFLLVNSSDPNYDSERIASTLGAFAPISLTEVYRSA